jgi:hypothetical protein
MGLMSLMGPMGHLISQAPACCPLRQGKACAAGGRLRLFPDRYQSVNN